MKKSTVNFQYFPKTCYFLYTFFEKNCVYYLYDNTISFFLNNVNYDFLHSRLLNFRIDFFLIEILFSYMGIIIACLAAIFTQNVKTIMSQ